MAYHDPQDWIKAVLRIIFYRNFIIHWINTTVSLSMNIVSIPSIIIVMNSRITFFLILLMMIGSSLIYPKMSWIFRLKDRLNMSMKSPIHIGINPKHISKRILLMLARVSGMDLSVKRL